jgi:CRISPR-associated protein Cmr2
VKRFKPFEEKAGRKCSLCGVRNALFCGKKGNQKWKENLIREDSLEENEGLCGVCYTKRVLDYPLPSLSKICLMDWLKNIKKDELVKLRTEINSFDEEMFFNPELDPIKNFIKEHSLDVKKQKKYYALLKLDIDDMGKWLSGKKGIDGKDLKTFQIELSEKLNEFSSKIKSIIDDKGHGQTVYAGGDDFLGFVNLKYLFETVKKIKDKFEDGKTLNKLTYSISIVISHYKSPLHKVLDLSRELMEETKNAFDDKNGVGVIVLSNSSIHSKCYCRHENFMLLEDLWEKKTGNNLHFKLGLQFPFLKDVYSYDNYLLNKSMLETEIIRLLKRENKYVEDEHVEGIINFLSEQTIEESSNANRINFENFIGYLKTLEQLRKVM